MSDMKCLFCQQELVKGSIDGKWLVCLNCHITGEDKLWLKLIHTCKALDLAKDTLHWYNDNYDSVVAQETINEITALEQKDVK